MTPGRLAPGQRETHAVDAPPARGTVFQVMPGVQRFVLGPLVTWLRRWSVPCALAMTVVMVAVMVVALSQLLGAGMLMAQQVIALAKELPTHRHNIQQKLRDLRPALVPSGTTLELARVFGMVEGEIAAAQKQLRLDTQSEPELTRVAVDTDADSSLPLQVLNTVAYRWPAPA